MESYEQQRLGKTVPRLLVFLRWKMIEHWFLQGSRTPTALKGVSLKQTIRNCAHLRTLQCTQCYPPMVCCHLALSHQQVYFGVEPSLSLLTNKDAMPVDFSSSHSAQESHLLVFTLRMSCASLFSRLDHRCSQIFSAFNVDRFFSYEKCVPKRHSSPAVRQNSFYSAAGARVHATESVHGPSARASAE